MNAFRKKLANCFQKFIHKIGSTDPILRVPVKLKRCDHFASLKNFVLAEIGISTNTNIQSYCSSKDFKTIVEFRMPT